MSYVQRNGGGAIMGVYRHQQSFASEFLPEDDPELVAFLAAPAIAEQAHADRLAAIKTDPGYADLVDRLRTMTPAQWQTYLTDNMTTLVQARIVIYRMGLALMAMTRQLP